MIRLFLVMFATLGFAASTCAQDFPSRALRIIVPYPAGSTGDIRSRELAPLLAARLGQPVIVDNKPGAGGAIGTAAAARAAPDGHTLLFGLNTNLAIVPHTTANPGYDTLKNFAPIAQVIRANLVLVVHPSLGITSLPELVRLARAKPGQLSYGSSGVGSMQHMAMELLKSKAGIDVLHVPYKGDNETLLDLVSGRLSMSFATFTAATPHIASGKLKALAVSGKKRSPNFGDVAPVAEQGYPDYEWHTWVGYLAPAGTPKAIIDRLNLEITDIYQTELRAKLQAFNVEVATSTPADFGALIKRDFVRYGKLVAELGMQSR